MDKTTNENESMSSFDKYIAPVKNSFQKGYYDLKDGTFTDKMKNGVMRNILIITIIILLIIFTIFTTEFNKLNYYGLTNFRFRCIIYFSRISRFNIIYNLLI